MSVYIGGVPAPNGGAVATMHDHERGQGDQNLVRIVDSDLDTVRHGGGLGNSAHMVAGLDRHGARGTSLGAGPTPVRTGRPPTGGRGARRRIDWRRAAGVCPMLSLPWWP